MCTVTIVASGSRCRLMCNRDERHDRADAHAPTITRASGQLAILPVDPPGGGTWIAATDAGLVFALLNDEGPVPPATASRGRLILELLDCPTLAHAVDRAGALYARPWAPHRLIATDGHSVVQLRGGPSPTFDSWSTDRPLMFTSSSLGEAAVRPARRALFDSLVTAAFDGASAGGADVWRAQETFHHHQWHDRPQISVHMRRHDAGTQSVTSAELTRCHVSMRHEPRDCVGLPVPLSLLRMVPEAAFGERSTVMATAQALAS